MLFINTLKALFINHMLGSATKSFSNILMSEKMIENVTRGKTKRSTSRKKENEVNTASVYNKSYSKSVTVGQPRTITTSHQGPSRQESNSRPNTKKLQFTPIPMTYRELYQNLFDAHVVSSFYLKPIQAPFQNAMMRMLNARITRHSISDEARTQAKPRKPVAFPYKVIKRVPWNYDCNVMISEEENSVSTSEEG
ncbi:trans-resveratrol di-O-methyltransferase-like [Gossypium australe]|uniref:Trans-resveratrol di-O-methyltransferase-like n=1 Tax=Gossypium australe TaxID=47621 RepID=A0A5B6VVB3_9ROSI|nr:trans-resveratrol di-O-methyltransferase-like [Gossypium australe]